MFTDRYKFKSHVDVLIYINQYDTLHSSVFVIQDIEFSHWFFLFQSNNSFFSVACMKMNLEISIAQYNFYVTGMICQIDNKLVEREKNIHSRDSMDESSTNKSKPINIFFVALRMFACVEICVHTIHVVLFVR